MSRTDGQSSDPAAKANDYAIEALKQLLTLATVTLALTVTFLKDALGEARSQAQWTYLVPVAWFFLIVVVWTAWVAIGNAARSLGVRATTGYVFGTGMSRRLARTAHWSFLCGLLCLALFATRNLGLFFVPTPAKVIEEVRAKRLVVVDEAGRIVWKAP